MPKTTALEPPMKTLKSTTPYRRFYLVHEKCALKSICAPGPFVNCSRTRLLDFYRRINILASFEVFRKIKFYHLKVNKIKLQYSWYGLIRRMW